jgi:AcrR family transcriptional regulator
MQSIREAALTELRRVGPAALSLREVARLAGISPSGLYRYVDGRDGLLELLIAEAFADYGRAIAAAIAEAPPDFAAQLQAVAVAYRHWARAHPEQFALILGSPVAGFQPGDDGATGQAAREFGRPMLSLFARAQAQGQLPPVDTMSPVVDLSGFGADVGVLPAAVLELSLRSWARIHGLVILEAFGHLAWAQRDVEDLLRAEVQAMIATCR